ncbi:MAG: hypothetical protein AB7T31_13910 [Gemmatimonadales bacterium]
MTSGVVRVACISVALQLPTWATGEVAAQDLARRVASVETGGVTFVYPTRDEVEICARGVSIAGRRVVWRGRYRDDDGRCARGTATVELRVDAGRVRDLDVLDLDDVADPEAVDLGAVGARDAAEYFLSLARSTGIPDAADDVAEDAVLAAALADVADLWPELLDLARDASVARDARRSALFWLGQEAGEAVTSGIAAIAADEREEQDVREAAIFALSQRPGDVGVSSLMEIARTAREAETRRDAMFWLAQSEDARVIAFFEEILLGR